VFQRLVMAFARAGSSPSRTRAAGVSAGVTVTRAAASGLTLGPTDDPGTVKDPENPAVTVTLLERVRLRVAPETAAGGPVPCGPFAWKWEEPIGKLDVCADTTAAYFYPVVCGTCLVTVEGGKRTASLVVNVVPAVPACLNLGADPPELYRSMAELDRSASTVV
jgi:hypothetical protein